jgi:hypothetical protein
MNRSARRAHALISAELTISCAALGGTGGFFIAGPVTAAILGVVTGIVAYISSLFIRRRAFAHLQHAESEVHVQAYGEGLSQAVLLGVATYEAAVFPMTGAAGVSAAERDARRTACYRIAADEGLPRCAPRRPPPSRRSTTGRTPYVPKKL